MPSVHDCHRQTCGCESHRTCELEDNSIPIPDTQRQWQVACRAHGGWLPTTLPTTLPSSNLQQQLHILKEREQALIDQLDNLHDEIARHEVLMSGENIRKRCRS